MDEWMDWYRRGKQEQEQVTITIITIIKTTGGDTTTGFDRSLATKKRQGVRKRKALN